MAFLRVLLAVLMLVLVWGGWPYPPSVQAQGAPKAPQAEVLETEFDFGEGFEDRELTHTFTIKNTGNSPLQILKVDPDCACTVADYDPRIAPGRQGKITLGIKPYTVTRRFAKRTTIHLNDPQQKTLVLTMKGVNKPAVEFKPSHIIRLKGPVGQELRDEVRIVYHLDTPWEITEYRATVPKDTEVNLYAEEPGRVYLLEVVHKGQEVGRFGGFVQLVTTSKQRPILAIRVFVEAYSPGPP